MYPVLIDNVSEILNRRQSKATLFRIQCNIVRPKSLENRPQIEIEFVLRLSVNNAIIEVEFHSIPE